MPVHPSEVFSGLPMPSVGRRFRLPHGCGVHRCGFVRPRAAAQGNEHAAADDQVSGRSCLCAPTDLRLTVNVSTREGVTSPPPSGHADQDKPWHNRAVRVSTGVWGKGGRAVRGVSASAGCELQWTSRGSQRLPPSSSVTSARPVLVTWPSGTIGTPATSVAQLWPSRRQAVRCPCTTASA